MILIAEDDQHIRRTLRRVLEGEGYQVLTARDGREALVLAEQHRPALVLSDIRMPHLSGVQLVHALDDRFQEARPKVVLTSAFECPDIDGADAFIPKPFNLSELLDTIRRLAGDGS